MDALFSFYSNHSLAVELSLDGAIIAAAAWLYRRGSRVVGWVLVSFIFTVLSTVNYQILSERFGVSLKSAMGTPMELVINAPYVAFFALGVVALIIATTRQRVLAAALSTVVLTAILAFLLQGLIATGNPLQNQILHVICFALTSLIIGFGAVNLFTVSNPLGRTIGVGYISIALSGLFFQITEIYPTSPLGSAIDLSWTLGQLIVLAALASLWLRHPPSGQIQSS
ncbi:MAG: hypothetical protein HYR96_01975 [Deltaproteobacteria bacterium]|nr:hypothetical protein [Deltaproteobacteria bacterium]MBI3295637.1 hypothetical protein [Deltaproteobacteria bacterium]